MNVTTDLDTRFRAAAVSEGLVDVRFDVVASPVGDLHVAATGRGLCRISYRADDWEEQLARGFGVRVLRSPLDDVRRELDEYFEGRRRTFDLPLDLRVAPFYADVLRELARVPYGRTDTYGALATRVGRPKAARAVGTVMNRNPIPIVLPCHRIVGANGSLTGYAGGLDVKRRLLELEGAMFGSTCVVIVGGGFGGLAAARKLRRADVKVTLVDRQNFFLFQPLVYQVATGSLSSVEVAIPLRNALRRQKNARVVLGEATAFDLAARTVTVMDLPNGGEQTLPYDVLAVAGGSRYSYSATTTGPSTRPS